jgi:ADP-ribose pyrophosphatase
MTKRLTAMRGWKTIKTEVVIDNEWLRIRKDICLLSNGKILKDYFIIEKNDVVTIFPITINGEVVLVKQYKHGIKSITLEFPGGYINKNESAISAAKRELSEETGYKAKKFKKIGCISKDASNSHTYLHIYLAVNSEKIEQQLLDNTENIDVVLMDVNSILKNIRNGKIIEISTIAAFFLSLKTVNTYPFFKNSKLGVESFFM